MKKNDQHSEDKPKVLEPMAVKYYKPQTTFTLSMVKAQTQTSSSMSLSLGMPLGDFNMLFCITRGWRLEIKW